MSVARQLEEMGFSKSQILKARARFTQSDPSRGLSVEALLPLLVQSDEAGSSLDDSSCSGASSEGFASPSSWEILLDRGWVAFDQRTGELFKEAEAAGKTSFQYQDRGFTYSVDMLGKRQVNEATGKCRVVRQLQESIPMVLGYPEEDCKSPQPFWLGSPAQEAVPDSHMFKEGDILEVWSMSVSGWCPGYVDVVKDTDLKVKFQGPDGDVYSKWIENGHAHLRPMPESFALEENSPMPFWKEMRKRSLSNSSESEDKLTLLSIHAKLQEMGFSREQVQIALDVTEAPVTFESVLRYLLISQQPATMTSDLDPSTCARELALDFQSGPESPQPRSSERDRKAVAQPEEQLAISKQGDQQEQPWECSICFTEQSSNGWACPTMHRFCADCMRHHADATPFPRCPHVGCGYELGEGDLIKLNVAQSRLEAFRHAKLDLAVDTLAGSGEVLVRCSDSECPNVVVLPAGSGRRQFACACGATPFCTQCKQAPYHFHADCSKVQALREQWLVWVSSGREAYHGQAKKVAQTDQENEANLALREAIARHEELEADERWKAKHCRLCPQCSRPIHRVAGCSSIVCGRNYHGGAQQPGCGLNFDWKEAQRYVANVERRELLEMSAEQVRLRGRGAYHPFVECQLCHEVGIEGPRFRCIHCQAFDACSKCEHRLMTEHPHGHVFDILFESDFQWSSLPRGTKVRLVRSGDSLPQPRMVPLAAASGTSQQRELEGLCGDIGKDLNPKFDGYRVKLELGAGVVEIARKHVEPLLKSRSQAEDLLSKSLETEDRRLQSPNASVNDSSSGSDMDDSDFYFEDEEAEESEPATDEPEDE